MLQIKLIINGFSSLQYSHGEPAGAEPQAAVSLSRAVPLKPAGQLQLGRLSKERVSTR